MEPILPEEILFNITAEPSTLSPASTAITTLPNEVKIGEFSDLKPEGADYGLLSGMNQNVNRASNQSGLDQLGNFLVNAGAEIAGGTIEGIGYLADFQQHANLIKGTEEEFSNWFSDYGKQLKDATEEAFPIYEAKPGEFNPWDSGFWAKNGVSIASSLSLLIPARGATGLLAKFGKAVGMESALAKGASLLGKEGEALQVAIRAAKQNTKGITAAILSRTMENTMEASGTFEEIYNTKLAEGYSEDDARNSAGEGARDVWYQNSVMLLQDIPQYMFLFKAPGLLKSEGKQLQKLMSGTTLKDVGTQFVSEAGEEVFQSVVGQEAKAKQLDKEYKNLNFEERLAQYLKEDEVLTSALFGGLGGAVVTIGGRAWENRVAKNYQNYEDMKLASSVGKDNLVQQVKDKQSIEVLSNHLDDLDKVKSEVEEIAKEEGADKTQIQNVLSDIDVAEQTKNSLTGIIDNKYIPAATQLNVEANQAARRLNKTTEQLNSIKELDSVKAQLNKVGSQAFDYNVSVNALKQIDKLRKQYSKNPMAQTALDELEKEHTQVVNDLAEYNKPISGITNQLNQHVNDLLVNEVEHRTKAKEFEEVSIGNTSVLDERVKKAEIEQLKAEKDIDKLLTIRDSEDIELSKVAKSRLKELYANEDRVIPENIEELTTFYEKNPITFKKYLKDSGMSLDTTLEEFNTLVQTPEFQQQFEVKKQSQVQDTKVAVEEAKVVEELSDLEKEIINEIKAGANLIGADFEKLKKYFVDGDKTAITASDKNELSVLKLLRESIEEIKNKYIPVEETPIASTDEQSDASNQPSQVKVDNTTTEDKKASVEKRKQALRDLMKTTGDDIFILGTQDGTFAGDGLLNMNENGDVVLTRYADSVEGLTKGKGKTENLADIAGQFGGEQIATSGIEGGATSFTNGVIGEYHIPLQELIDLIKDGHVVFAGLGNKEFVLSPHIADKYLSKINGKLINSKQETNPTKQQFDITNQEEQDDLVDTKEGEWTDTSPNRIKTTDAYMYYYDDGIFYIPSMAGGKFTEEEFNSKYQKGNVAKGYHVLYDQAGQVVFMKNEPTLDVEFLRNLSQVGDVYNEPVTLEVDRNYKNGDKSWSNSKPLGDDKNGWKSLKVAVKIQGKTIGFLPDYDGVRIDPNNLHDLSKFEQLRKTIFNNVKSSTGIYTYPVTTTLKSINPPRFWQGPRTQELLPLQQKNADGTKKPIILGLVKNGKLFLNNAPISDKQKEELEGKFNLSDGAVYWLLTNPVTGDYVPYRLFTSKVKDNPKVQEDIKKLLSSITEHNWKDKRNELQELVRWKNDVGKYEPDFGYTKAGKFFVVKDGEKVYDITPEGVYDFYINERGFNIIEDSPLQVEAEQLNQPNYNEALINQKYFTATLNAGLFHSPNFRINIEPLVADETKVVERRITRGKAKFSTKDNRQVTKWNKQEETQWFKDKIGELIDFNVVDEAEMNSVVESLKHIHGKDNVEAWGLFNGAAVYVLNNGRKGQSWHESYHVVETLVLTDSQIASLNKINTEEDRAELFEDFVAMSQIDEAKLKLTPWYKQLGASIKRLFRKIYLAIKASVGLNLSQDEIFFRINSGAYKNNKGFKRNVDVFKPSIKAYADNLKQQDRLNQVQREFNEMYLVARDKGFKEGLTEQQILDKALKPTLNGNLNTDNIYYQLSQTFLNEAAQSRLDGDEYAAIEYEELSKKIYDGEVVSNRIADKFGPVYWNALDNLKNYGIRVNRLQGDLDINDETQDSLENWMEVHPPSAYEAISKQIKMGLAALPRGEFVGEEFEVELDDLGYARFVDPFEVYSFLKDELSDSLSVEDFMESLEKLGEDISWAKVLHQILNGERNSTIIVDTQLFKSQLYQFFQEPAPTFKYLLQTIKNKKEGQYEWRFNNSASKSIATRLSTEWLSNINSPLYNKTLEDGKVDELKTQLNDYIKENKNDNNWLYKALNDLGITLSKEVIESVTEPKKGNKRDFLDNFKKVVDNVGKENFDELLSVKNSLIEMAKLVKQYYPEFHLPAFTNVEGETVQNYIRNSFMARQLNKFKSSKYRKELIDFYRTDKFYAPNDRTKKDTKTGIEVRDDSYSLWLDRIQNDAAYNKMDFAVLDGQKLAGETTGTPYADLSPLEFNRMTLNAFYNNGNYSATDVKTGKSFYSAQIMADSGSHAYIGFESYSQEHIINKLVMMAQNEYFAYLHNQIEENKTGIKGYNPKLMFIPGLIENRNNLSPAELQEKAIELIRKEEKLREAIKTNLDKIVADSIKEFNQEGLIEGDKSIHLDYRIKDINEFIKDFVYNDFFAQTQIISLFHGKLYQYKSMEDFYKRAKEIWSPGNFIDTSRGGVNQKFMTYFVDSKSTELNYRNNKESVDAIYNNILGAEFSEDDAKKAASGYGYTDGTNDGKAVTLSNGKIIESGEVDATDAQGIIDMDRWREIMLGKGMEKNEVERIYDAMENETYTIDDLSMVLNPIKQFYYTLIIVNGQVTAIQIKNSEYVLPKAIAKGNAQLEGILKFLRESKKKHLVNASINYNSAVKVGLHNINASTETLDVNNAIELDNNEYRIQGEVPEHQVDTTNLLGTQLRKLIVGDLNLEDVYEVNGDKVNGGELINEWNQLLIADIWHSSESLKKEFSNPIEFYKMLQDEARSRDYPDKFIEALTLVDGKPRLGLFHPLLTKKAQALISSVFRNRITKMKFNGMSTPNAALSNKKLSILYNSDGSIKAFEAELPLWSKSLVEGMDVVTTEELAKLGLDLGVAYRIPTEGKYSMIPIKIVGFTNAGITLPSEITKVAGLDYDIDKMYVMLYEFITKKGKPVKVEFQKEPTYKEYVKSVKYSKDVRDLLKKEEVDVMSPDVEGFLVDKELLLTEAQWSELNVYQQNSQKARDNRKLDIIRSVLNNPKTIKAQLTPGGFDDLKAEANRIEDVKGDKLDKINPMTLISRVKIFSRMMAGKKLIGVPANYNATHALMQHNNLELTKPVLFNGFEGKNLGLLYALSNEDFIIKDYEKLWKDGTNSNKAVSVSLKNKPDEIFELVKDKEDGFYSIHFKTTGIGTLSNEEKQKLVNKISSLIPIGSKLSTWGKVTKGGYSGLDRFLKEGFVKTDEVRTHDGNGIPIYVKTKANISNTKLVSNNFAQYLASVVDNGKDPLADKYNLNTYTADVAMLMAKFFPIETGMKFIAQPSIVEFYKEYVNQGANFKAEQKAIEKILGYSKAQYNKLMEDFVLENINDADLETGLKENPKDGSQKKMLMHFLYYKNNQAKDLSKLVSAIKVPDSGASASIAKTVNNVAKVNDALKLETIVGVKEFLNNENLANTYLYEKGIQDALKEFVKLGFPDYVKPDSAFVKVFDQLAELKGSILSEKEIGLVNDATYSFLSSAFEPIKNIKTLEVIKNVPKLWSEFIKLNRKEYYALMGSIDSVASEHNEKELKLVLNNNQPKDVENKVMNQWEDLLKSSKSINSNYTEDDLGKMLTEYAFVTNGFRFTTGSLSHIQPISFYENLRDNYVDFNTFIEQQIDAANNDETFLSQFYDQFVRHYFPRLSYVKSVEKEDGGIRLDEKTKEPYSVTINDFQAKDYIKYRDTDTRKWYLFKMEFMDTESGTAYYNRINPLGLYREVEEWNFELTQKNSLFEQNNMSKEIENLFDEYVEANDVENTVKVVEGINISTRATDPLGLMLTNPNWKAKQLMDVEAPYKANASKIKAPQLNPEEALKYDMNLMYQLQLQKFRKNPELIDMINERGGLEFIKKSSHTVGVKGSRWEGVGMESNFIKVLTKSYETVAKELNKFVESTANVEIGSSFEKSVPEDFKDSLPKKNCK